MGALEDRYYTLEEYFDRQEVIDEKTGYHDGLIYALAGGTSNYSIIAGNIRQRLAEKPDDTDWDGYDSDIQLVVETENRYRFPDAMVVCWEREFADDRQMRIKHPVRIVEVLSNITQGFDKTEKFRFYRAIPSFREYMPIYPEKYAVDAFHREEKNIWLISSGTGPNGTIHLFSLGISTDLKDIYAKIQGVKNE